MSKNTVIVYAKRTAIGKFCGALASTPAPKLGASLVKNALGGLALKGEEVDEIIMGQVLSAGVGQAPARQTGIYGGLPNSVPAMTINKVCGSGMKAVMLGDQAIARGDAKVMFVGGQESMSLAPHILPASRSGFRFGPVELRDHMQWDGLTDPYEGLAMGVFGETCAKKYEITRADQDEFALRSYERSRLAMESGWFKDEIVGVEVQQKSGSLLIDQDEEPFGVDIGKLKNLRPAFDPQGSITAGNASSISDGAALLVVMDESFAKQRGFTPLARVVASATFAHQPSWFTSAPVEGIKKVLSAASLKQEDIDFFEINEAFSVVPLVAIKRLGLDPQKVNVRGGAVSLGHPIGASGARIIVTLLHALKREKKKRGLASVCIGGGESCNMIIETL